MAVQSSVYKLLCKELAMASQMQKERERGMETIKIMSLFLNEPPRAVF